MRYQDVGVIGVQHNYYTHINQIPGAGGAVDIVDMLTIFNSPLHKPAIEGDTIYEEPACELNPRGVTWVLVRRTDGLRVTGGRKCRSCFS